MSCTTTNQKQLYDYWIRIHVEKKDGSKYVERNEVARTYAALEITPKYIYEEIGELGSFQKPYHLIGDTIINKYHDSYKVNFVNDSLLILLENDDERPDDKINKFIYLNEKKYRNYIFDNGLVEYENDTTIILSKVFLPYYNRMWDFYISKKYKSINKNGHVSMEVLLDSKGRTYSIKLVNYVGVSKEFAEKILRLIGNTQAWNLSLINRNYYYKINLVAYFKSLEDYKYAGIRVFVLNPEENIEIDKSEKLSMYDVDFSNQAFKNGMLLIEENKLDSALIEFTKCIKIDSLYLDAYYNRAYINFQKNKLNECCADWKYLSEELGQKYAEKLYKEYCECE